MPSKGFRSTHCKRGHKRNESNVYPSGACRLCDNLRDRTDQKQYKREWEKKDRAKDPEKYKVKSLINNASPAHKQAQRNWKVANPNHDSEYYRNNIDKFKEDSRTYNLSKLGWSVESYKKAEKEQHKVCAICGKPCPTGRRLAADHKHVDPPIPRGLLCVTHNLMIGYAKDSPEVLRAAALYLEKYSENSE
jgi:RNA polymerase-binding transcription factor DksA